MTHDLNAAVRSDRDENIGASSGVRVTASGSLLQYAPALVLLAIAVADFARYADTDLWGHVLFGEAAIRLRGMTLSDPYSYSAAGHIWLHHEWLSEVLMGGVYSLFGMVGLKLLKLICSATVILMLTAAEGETGAPLVVQFAVLIAAAFAVAPQMQFRPQMFTFAFVAALMAGLTRDNCGRAAPLWLAIPGLAVWANLHGGFFIGIVMLGVYTVVVGIQDFAARRGMARTIRLAALTMAGTYATLLTPFRLEGWFIVAHSLTNPMTRHVVADWLPLMAVVAGQLHGSHTGISFLICALALLGAAALSFLLTPRGGDLPLVAIAAVMTVAAFLSVRNLALAVITASVPLTRHLGLLFAGVYGPGSNKNGGSPQRLSRPTQLIIGALAMVLALGSGLFSSSLPAAANYPAGAVAFMKANELHGDILNYFSWGQYLIWHMAPQSKVFIDGRFDLVYPPQVITDYLDFYNAKPDAKRVLELYRHDFVLIPPDAPVYAFMSAQKEWKRIYLDDNAALLVRAGSAGAKLAPVVVDGPIRRSYFP